MPLSEHEQRQLEQIERALYAEDPKFASTVRGGRFQRPSRRRGLQGVAVFVLGLALLVLGVSVIPVSVAEIPVVSVVGFLVMFGGAVIGLSALRGGGAEDGQEQPEGESGRAEPRRKKSPPQNRPKGSLSQRMEERFRKRFDQ
ncbi:DUF3040 domain-containing protein [Saccharopolyspora sp. HNM0983]|uniref:DUF3040 domain-containing protein n=1 Tax=Saccharopolyspora montiporae TaxID=2781240 RepID=A0A929G137_9PSEU|nr:DUF3040 domain-containing protein [Saccharopolyspora sp. HNM0983]MBE9374273.1 DUF3040 domain-containing protein [Saccharopolyspora sp. HNM0983]